MNRERCTLNDIKIWIVLFCLDNHLVYNILVLEHGTVNFDKLVTFYFDISRDDYIKYVTIAALYKL